MNIRVYYEDTDAGGIVYHANYIKYCERARSEYLFAQGVMPGIGADYGFVVRKLTANYLASSSLGDMLEVRNKMIEIKNSSFVLSQKIYKDSVEVFSMDIVLVYMQDRKVKRIPEHFRELFANISNFHDSKSNHKDTL